MNAAINEAFAEMCVLAQLISTMKKNARKLKRASQDLEESDYCETRLVALEAYAQDLSETAGKSQERMQFADRMHHRLFDVQSNLKKIAELVEQRQGQSKKGSWGHFFRDSEVRSVEQQILSEFDARL